MADQQPISTGEQPVSQARDEIIKAAHRLEEDLLHSSKGQFEAARLWGFWHWSIGIPIVALAALASASALPKLGDSGLIAAGLSLVVAVLSALQTFVNAQEKVLQHQGAGTKYHALLGRVRLFRAIDCVTEINETILTDRLRVFVAEQTTLNESCPAVPRRAYNSAKRGIDAGEAEYRIDKKP
jgi:hypothetical protein